MGIELPNGKISRTLPEQVGENTRRLSVLEAYQIQSFYKEDGHLYAKRVNGEAIDLGLLVDVSGFSINENQHLIVNYNDGTTQDLGAIFSGNVNIAGNFTANSIIENMSGYSVVNVFPTTYGSLTLDYAGVCKNGNKITFAVAGKIMYNSTGINNGGANIVNFIIPEEIGQKLYPTNIGNQTNLLYLSTVNMYGSNNSFTAGRGRVTKNNNTALAFLIYSAGMSTDVEYSFRIEATFLLSDNLAS